jgi:hypothetical protein
MPDAPRVHVSAMEGKGAYNRNAAIPASGGAFAIPLLEKAAQQISLNSDDRPIVIADYGSSQEKTRSRPHVLQLQPFECAPVGNGRFSCATPTSQPMTSAKCLRCSRATRKAICKANRRFFHMRSAALLSEAVPARLRRSRVEFLRRRLAQPDSCADPGPLLHSLLDGLGSGRVRSPGGTRLGIIPDPTGSRAAGGRPFGCRAARARSRWNGRVRFDDEPRERRTL